MLDDFEEASWESDWNQMLSSIATALEKLINNNVLAELFLERLANLARKRNVEVGDFASGCIVQKRKRGKTTFPNTYSSGSVMGVPIENFMISELRILSAVSNVSINTSLMLSGKPLEEKENSSFLPPSDTFEPPSESFLKPPGDWEP